MFFSSTTHASLSLTIHKTVGGTLRVGESNSFVVPLSLSSLLSHSSPSLLLYTFTAIQRDLRLEREREREGLALWFCLLQSINRITLSLFGSSLIFDLQAVESFSGFVSV